MQLNKKIKLSKKLLIMELVFFVLIPIKALASSSWMRVEKKEFAHQWYSYNIFANKLKYDNVPILREWHFQNVTEKADHLYYKADFKNNKDAQIQIPDEKIMLDGSLIQVRGKDITLLKSIAFMNTHAKATLTKDLGIDKIRVYFATQTLTINRNVNFQGRITGKGTVQIIGKNIVPPLGNKKTELSKILVKNKGNIKDAAILKDVHAKLLNIDGMAIIDSDYISSDILLAKSATIKFNKALTTNPRINGQDIGGQEAYGMGHVEFSGGGMVGHIGTNQPVASVKFDSGRYEIAGNIRSKGDIIFNKKGQYIPSITEAEIEGNFNLIPNLWVEVADNKLITLQKKRRLDIIASWNSTYSTEDDLMINQTDERNEPKKNLPEKSKNIQQSKEKYQKLSDIWSGFQLMQDRDNVNSKSKEAEKIAKATIKELIEKAMNEAIRKTKKDDNVVIEADNPKQKEYNYNKEADILDDQSDKLSNELVEHNKNVDNEQESPAVQVKNLLKQVANAKKEIAAIEEIKKDLKTACKELSSELSKSDTANDDLTNIEQAVEEVSSEKQEKKNKEIKKNVATIKKKIVSTVKDKSNDRIKQSKIIKDLLEDDDNLKEVVKIVTKDSKASEKSPQDIIDLSRNDTDVNAMDSDNRELIKMLADSFDETAAIEIDKNNNDNIARITAENINYMSNTVIASVSRRFNEMTFISGAAAGGEVTGFDNVWIRGLIGTGKEKQGEDRYGYKSNMRGVIVGVDYLINEGFLAGVSYSNLYSQVKSKRDKVLQNIGINSNILSLYAQYDLTNKIYMQGMLSAGKNKIKTDRTLTILAKDYRGTG